MGSETWNADRKDVLWGLDLSVSAGSIGWMAADASRRGVVTAVWNGSLRDGTRLRAAYDSMFDCASRLAIDHPAVFGYFEQPSGRSGKPTLVYMAGVLQLAIFNALHLHWHRPVDFRAITSGEWKRDVVAVDGYAKNGSFGKPDKKKGETIEDYPAYRWAHEVAGYQGGDINEVDAICIAEKARREVRFG